MTYELLDNLLLESKNIEENIEIDELDKEDFKRLDSRINICMKELSYNIISESDMHKFKKKQLIESLHETDFNEREIDKFIKEVINPILELSGIFECDNLKNVESVSFTTYDFLINYAMKYDTNLRTENYNYDNNIKDLKERYNLNDLDIFTLEEQAPRLVKKLNNGELIQSLFELSELVYTGILARGSILNLLSEVEEKISKHLDMYGKGHKVSKKFHKAMKFSMARKDVDNIIRPESINTESSNINNGKQSIGLATTTAASVYAYNKDKKSCSKLKGDAKTKCLKDASGSGLAVTTSQSKDCDKTKNPEKCKAKLNKEMNNWQKKMSIAEDMGGDTGGAAGGWSAGNSAAMASYESPATIKVKKKKIQKRIGEIYFNKKKIKKPKESGEQKDNGEPQNQTDDWQVNSLADYGSDQIGGVV